MARLQNIVTSLLNLQVPKIATECCQLLKLCLQLPKLATFINIKVDKHENNCRLANFTDTKVVNWILNVPDFPDDDNGGITLSHPIVNVMGQLLMKTNKIYY